MIQIFLGAIDSSLILSLYFGEVVKPPCFPVLLRAFISGRQGSLFSMNSCFSSYFQQLPVIFFLSLSEVSLFLVASVFRAVDNMSRAAVLLVGSVFQCLELSRNSPLSLSANAALSCARLSHQPPVSLHTSQGETHVHCMLLNQFETTKY